ncbi:MAG: hypothetical protein RLY78_1734 [Pseudomonadota bacterium]
MGGDQFAVRLSCVAPGAVDAVPGVAGCDAVTGAEAASAGRSRSGPFWPQPPSRPSASALPIRQASAARGGVARGLRRGQVLATLESRVMPRILETMSAAPPATPLSDSDFHRLSHAVLQHIETTADRWLEDDVIDIDVHRTGGLLELSFPGGSKIVINTQPPLHELWLASKAAGQHFRHVEGRWIDTRDGHEFFAVLSTQASAQGGKALRFDPPV